MATKATVLKMLRIILLAPVSLCYWFITTVRNIAYDCGWLRSRQYNKAVICVGNITVGGTGKTPVTESVTRHMHQRGEKVAIVSRGYRRKTKGQIIATPRSTAADIGDEPCQMKHKMPWVDLIVDANRAAAIDQALKRGATTVIMDDGMQHRSVQPTALIMVCDYARMPFDDWHLPSGNLREHYLGRLRADIVIVNKCPENLTTLDAEKALLGLNMPSNAPVFFTALSYGELIDQQSLRDGGQAQEMVQEMEQMGSQETNLHLDAEELDPETPVVAVAGIGRPDPFFREVESRFAKVETMAFADHHDFSPTDMNQIRRRLDALGPDSVVICTEKDAMRMPAIERHRTLALPIGLKVLFGQEAAFWKAVETKANMNEH